MSARKNLRSGSWIAGPAAAVLLLTPAARGLQAGESLPELPGFAYRRAIQVPAAGLVHVPLDAAALGHMAPDGDDLRLFDPDGRPFPASLAQEGEGPTRRPARVLAVEPGEEGWWLRIDAGPDPQLHQRLLFEMAETGLAEVRLESSADGENWKPLAAGQLFRLGEATGHSALTYEASNDRWLRLWWPSSAGFPNATSIRIEARPSHVVQEIFDRPDCRTTEIDWAECRLPLSPGARRLTLETAGEGPVGFRLLAASAGAWQPLVEGVWARAGSQALDLPRVPSRSLRLELYGSGVAGAAPRLLSYRSEGPSPVLSFRAARPGRYALAYGALQGPGARPDSREPAADGESGVWLEAGPEIAAAERPLAVAAPGGPIDSEGFALARRVVTRAEPGAVVRLPLPGEVYRVTQGQLGELRLVHRGRQLPYLRRRLDVPAPLGSGAYRPEAATGSAVGRFEVPLAAPWLPAPWLELTGDVGPFRRRARVLELDRSRAVPGAEPRTLSPWGSWQCAGAAPLRCRHLLPLPAGGGEGLAVEIDGGDNPLPGSLAARVWRAVDEIVFVWPETGEVELLAGKPGLPAPRYDLSLAAPDLLRREATVAELASGPEREREGGRMALLAALGLTTALLVLLLARLLRGKPGEPAG